MSNINFFRVMQGGSHFIAAYSADNMIASGALYYAGNYFPNASSAGGDMPTNNTATYANSQGPPQETEVYMDLIYASNSNPVDQNYGVWGRYFSSSINPQDSDVTDINEGKIGWITASQWISGIRVFTNGQNAGMSLNDASLVDDSSACWQMYVAGTGGSFTNVDGDSDYYYNITRIPQNSITDLRSAWETGSIYHSETSSIHFFGHKDGYIADMKWSDDGYTCSMWLSSGSASDQNEIRTFIVSTQWDAAQIISTNNASYTSRQINMPVAGAIPVSFHFSPGGHGANQAYGTRVTFFTKTYDSNGSKLHQINGSMLTPFDLFNVQTGSATDWTTALHTATSCSNEVNHTYQIKFSSSYGSSNAQTYFNNQVAISQMTDLVTQNNSGSTIILNPSSSNPGYYYLEGRSYPGGRFASFNANAPQANQLCGTGASSLNSGRDHGIRKWSDSVQYGKRMFGYSTRTGSYNNMIICNDGNFGTSGNFKLRLFVLIPKIFQEFDFPPV